MLVGLLSFYFRGSKLVRFLAKMMLEGLIKEHVNIFSLKLNAKPYSPI